ncbi:MAG TPA: hypothetical protein VN726_12520 [Hanamia sp.]|jgi:hypothetical protein|nr:hypothetical protein [Hanamia sp.]HXS56943.1 hypothetical protein [Hanamia sp.]
MRKDPEVQQQMFQLIEQWKQSGLSQNAFCQQESIRFHKFYYWYKCYRRQHDREDTVPGFVKLKIEKPPVTSSVEVHFPGGIRVLFHEPVNSNYLKALIS